MKSGANVRPLNGGSARVGLVGTRRWWPKAGPTKTINDKVITVEDMDDDGSRTDVGWDAGIIARVQAVGLADDQSAGCGIANNRHAQGSFVIDHAAVVIPKDEIGSHAVLSDVARQFQRTAALDVFLRATVDFRSRFCSRPGTATKQRRRKNN